jgi:phosphosulfolactate synthase
MNNFKLKQIPVRTLKPRKNGLTMVMDKGLSIREVEDFISVSGDYVDLVKFGFGTSFATAKLLEQKIKLFEEANIGVYFGGTLFEAFIVRNQFEDYLKLLDKYKMKYVEVSDGSIDLPHDVKCDFIRKLSKNFTVLSEVGSKDVEKIIPPYQWIDLMCF